MSKSPSGEEVAGTVLMAAILFTLIAVVLIATALAAGAKEVGAVYSEHAQPGSPHRNVLLAMLAAFGGIALVLGVVAVAVPGATVACVVTFAWALLAFVVVVEGVDFAGGRRLKDSGNVASYLNFSPDAGAGTSERVALP
ncbi:MAG: hypothetical protein M3Z66_10035 [Chloroflexota bacterium]|nr:hypothetical protein [Chloroflexota bacterium]